MNILQPKENETTLIIVKLHTWLNMEIKQTKIQSLMTSNGHLIYYCYIMIPQTVM